MRKYLWSIVIAVVVLLIIFGGAIVGLYSDWLWFKDLGYGVVFSKMLVTRIEVGLLFGLLFFVIIYSNLWYARRIAPPPSPMGLEHQLVERLGRLARSVIGLVLFGGSIVVSAMVGLEAATHWESWLKYFNATPFGMNRPHVPQGYRFLCLQAAAHQLCLRLAVLCSAVAAIAAAALHYADEGIELFGNRPQFAPGVKTHLAVLVAAMFFLKAWGYRLAMYNLLFTRGSLFDGAGYTEVHARLPALWILLVVAIVGGFLVLFNIFRRGIDHARGRACDTHWRVDPGRGCLSGPGRAVQRCAQRKGQAEAVYHARH